MAEPSNLALLALCLKTSDRSCMPSMVKLGECFLKYSFLASLTRLVSWLNPSEWLCLSTLYQGRISCHLELGGPSEVVLDVVLPRGMLSTGSGEGCCLLGLGECSGAREGATGADGCSMERLLVLWLGCGCLSHQYVIGSYQCASEFCRARL